MTSGRIMAIDYGSKRMGIAITDENCIIARNLDTVMIQESIGFISNYLKKEKVKCIVLGQPKKLDNTFSEIYNRVIKFGKTLQKKFPDIEIVLYDERFTSKMAFQSMIDGGLNKTARRNKALIDSISAVILLQSYMEAIKHSDFKPQIIS